MSGASVAIIFALYSGYFALRMLRDRPPQPGHLGRLARGVGAVPAPLIGFLIGGFSAIAGVGGASLTVPFLLRDLSRLFSFSGFALTVALAVAPVPTMLLFAAP